MRPAVRLAAYAAALGLTAGAGAVLGATIGPDPGGEDRPASPAHAGDHRLGSEDDHG